MSKDGCKVLVGLEEEDQKFSVIGDLLFMVVMASHTKLVGGTTAVKPTNLHGLRDLLGDHLWRIDP